MDLMYDLEWLGWVLLVILLFLSLLYLKNAIRRLDATRIIKLQNVKVYEGGPAEYSIIVNKPDTEVSWFVNDHEVHGGDKYDILSDGVDRKLVIKKTELSDDGATIAVVVNGTGETATCELTVKEIQLSARTVYEGQNAEFICEVYQDDIEVSWFVNDKEATGERYTVSSHGLVRTLVIKDTKLTDDGSKVTVRVNDQDKSVQLAVKDDWQQFDKFVEHMDVQLDTAILDELISQCVMFITDREEIEKPPSPRQRNEVLLDILKQRPFPTLSIFIDVLDRAEGQNPDVKEFAHKYRQSTTTKIDNMKKTEHHPQNISGVADELVKLHKNYRTIVEGLDECSTNDILDHLLQDAVIRKEDQKTISSCKTSYQMNRCLLSTITQKGTTALRSLYKIIEKINVEFSQQIQNIDVTEQDKIRVLYGREDYIQRGGTFEVDANTKRWILVGIELHTVLTPALRKYVTPRLGQLWTKLKTSHNIDTQIYPNHLKDYNTKDLNYETINNNNKVQGRNKQKRFDYCIRDAVDLSKLFLQTDMTHYSTFDKGCDASALLGIIINTGICPPRGKEFVEKVRSEIRNSWAHCDLRDWTDEKYTECLNLMIQLVQNIGFSAEEEKEVIQQFDKWKQNGKEFLGGKQPESFGLTDIQTEIQKLVRCVKTFTDDPKQIDTIQKTLSTVDQTLEAHSKTIKDLTNRTEQLEQCKDSNDKRIQAIEKKINDHIPQHKQEQFEKSINEWIVDDKMFVPTEAAEEVMTKIKEHNFVVATGNSGTGKTYTVRHTALMMEKEGYIIVPAVNPEDISEYFRYGCKTVFVFDDLCGRFTLDDNVLSQWKSHKQSLKTILKDDCCKVLASCRLQVFKENKMTSSFCSEIDVNECKIRCLLNEKCLLIEQYFGNKPETITEEKLSKFDFLPFLCSNIKNKSKDLSELEKCFENPFAFYSDEFTKLFHESDDGKRKCCALILCVLYNNTLTWDELRKKSDTFCSVLENCELSSSESPFKIKTVLKSLVGVYITCDNDDDGTYKIIHDKLFDFIAKYFGEEMTDLFIKFADSNFLRERFSIKGRQKSETNDCIELSDDKNIELFMERMVCDWMKGEVNNVFRNTNMKSEQFRQELLSYLKHLPSQRDLVLIREKKSGNTPLLKICLYGDEEFAKWILDLGADINLGNNNKSTPLKIACGEGHTNLVKVLLKYESIDVNQSDVNGWTALHEACYMGYVEIVTDLIQHNVDINSTLQLWYSKGFTPLMLACEKKHLEVVKVLLQCEQIDVHQSADDGTTALHLACKRGNVGIVTELIKRGMDINQKEGNGWTPLMLAIKKCRIDVVKVLLHCEQIDVNQSADYGTTALHEACKSGNVEIVTELIKRGMDINQKEGNGWTPLMIACTNNHLEVVKVLLQCKQIDVNQSADDGTTALHEACKSGNVEIVTELIKRGMDINQKKGKGFTPLMFACKNKHLEVVKVLLQCEQIDVNQSADEGTTALHEACKSGNVEIVTELIKRGMDINQKTGNGWTPLMIACTNNHLEVVKVLLQCKQIDVNQSADDGTTALHEACKSGNVEIVTELIKRGMDINQKKGNGWTPLMIACTNNHLEVVKVLLQCEQIDVNQSADDGTTALHEACKSGNVGIVTEIMQHNVDINSTIEDGYHKGFTPLMFACENKHLEVVKVLLQCEQIDVNQSADDGTTALHGACMMGNVEIVTEIIKRGMDINQKKGKGFTPLMFACTYNNLEVVKVLLQCEQIDVNQSADDGTTALHEACKSGNVEIVTELIKRGMDINQKEGNGFTPLMFACNKHLEVVKVLLQCEQIDVNQSADDGTTALHEACKSGNVGIVTEIIQRNVDINSTIKDWYRKGFTPLMLACTYNHLEVVKVLLQCEQIDVNQSADYGTTALHEACEKENVEIVTELIKRGVDINQKKGNGFTPLMFACENKHLEVVKVLLKCEQIDVNQSADYGTTALHEACKSGNVGIVTELIKRGMDINQKKGNGWTPLMIACTNNHLEVVKVLLQCEQIDVNQSDDDGTTALHEACIMGNVEIVTEIIKRGMDINQNVGNGFTPLIIACTNNHLEVVKVLLQCEQIDVNQSADDGWTALHWACLTGNVGIVTEIMQHNVDINSTVKDGYRKGFTPLMFACTNNCLEVVKVLLQCEQIDVNQSADDGNTALHEACEKGNVEIVTDLIKRGMDINQKKGNGSTPLMFACENKHFEVVKVLTKCDQIDVNHSDNRGRTALHFACVKGNIDIVQFLIEHNVDVNKVGTENRSNVSGDCEEHYTDDFKKYLESPSTDLKQEENFLKLPNIWSCQMVHTKVVKDLVKFSTRNLKQCRNKVNLPLFVACIQNHVTILQELLKCSDIEINRRNVYGQTALYWACLQRHVDAIAVLVEHQADVNISDNIGISPLHIACWARNKEAIRLLIEHGADKTLQDIDGKTPMDIAVDENDQECLTILN